MEPKQVVHYYARWDLDHHTGRIVLYDSNNRLVA